MKTAFRVILLTGLICTYAQAQYQVKSSYLNNPQKAIGFVDSCATFWQQTYDYANEGFFTFVDKFGNVTGTNKNMLTQTRNAYGLVRAFMLTGNTNYLILARRALGFMYDHAWDPTYGGWYRSLDDNGIPIDPFTEKIMFDQLYGLLGISAYVEATQSADDWAWLENGYNHNETLYWDTRPNYEGYYDVSDYDGTNARNKSFNATVDAITTHVLYLHLMTGDQIYTDRLVQLADQMIEHLVGSMDFLAIGIVEIFDSDWNWNDNETMTLMGHVLKTAWCLGRIYQRLPNPGYIPAMEKLALEVLQNGYDHEFGGPYKDYNRITGQMLMWGNPDTLKASWQLEQAFTAGMQLFDITGDSLYLQMADETLNFFMRYFVDHQNGEIYSERTRYGGFAWHENKADAWKAGYHSIEFGYYVYLYGSLFYTHEPVTLHYLFPRLEEQRIVQLTPLAIADNKLRIQNVVWEGQAYANFDAYARILTLPSGIGGHFVVTYEPVEAPVSVDNVIGVSPMIFKLQQNYPNPFNPTTTIAYSIQTADKVSLKVYDALGREIKVIVDEYQSPGMYRYTFNSADIASGIYFYTLQIGTNYSETKKMMVIK